VSQAEITAQRLRSFLRLPAVSKATTLSRSAVYREMAKGSFPKPIRLGPNSVAWDSDDIAAWQAERLAARGE